MVDTVFFEAEPKRRYAVLALGLSLLSIGLGHIYVGQTARGWWFALTLGMLSLIITGLAYLPPSPGVGVALIILSAVLILAWLYAGIESFVTAYRLRTIELGSRRWKLYLLLLMVDFTVGSAVHTGLGNAKWKSFYTGSGSMEPTIRAGETFAVWHGYFADHEPRRGDLATVAVPTGKQLFIKRIVGLPGDRLQMRGGHLYLDDKPVQVAPGPAADRLGSGTYAMTPFVETLPGGRRYEIGHISGAHQFDDTGAITIPAGQYFILGDNRDNSLDSRMPTIGLIPRANLRDEPTFVLWSPDLRRIGQTLD
jgi:signal peptidase I